jgi:arsenite methyltransferase
VAVPGFIAKQLGRPSGWFGRHVMAHFLNRKTAAHNEVVRQVLAVAPGDHVLEVGFGGAALLARLSGEVAHGSVSGVEISDEMLAFATQRLGQAIAAGRVVLKRGNVEALPFGDRVFDRACTVNTTYFWSDLGVGLGELRRVLRPGGRLVIGFVSPDDIVRDGLDRHGFARHSAQELTLALERARFEVGELRSGSDSRGRFHVLAAGRAG